ncbi:MAG TPA: hypothetical protein PKN75_01800 [Bacteroidia bacterium]|nr:hypothetical protein [Bacteroidia bacterium]HNU32308.1 hypothetical protein [Bacteroidia bacterium]
MHPISSILFKSLVNTFYQRHAGLFLVFFLLMFGVIPPQNLLSYHQKLLEAFLGDSIFRMVVYFFWLLYMFKCIQFVFQQTEKPQYQFIYEINAVNSVQKFFAIATTLLWLLLPVLLYGLVAVMYAANKNQFTVALETLAAGTVLQLLSSYIIHQQISKREDDGLSKFLNFLSLRLPKPYIIIILIHVLNDLKVVFGVTKLFSIICLIISFAFCDAGVYDIRVVMLGLLFSMLAHTTLLFELRKFEETQLLYMRNTPQTIFGKWLRYVLLMAIVLIPEFLLLINVIGDKITFVQLPVLILFCISILLSFIASLYRLPFNKDKAIINPAYIVLVVFFLIIYKMFLVIITLLLILSLFLMYTNFYRFELIEEKK